MRREIGGGAEVVTVNPATGEELQHYPATAQEELDGLLTGAVSAQREWAGRSTHDRSPALLEVARLLRERGPSLARTASLEMGKPISEALAEVRKCAWACEYSAQHSPDLLADRPVDGVGRSSWVAYEPMGLILAVMPWNFPFWQVFRFASSAIMAGNGCLLKHSPNVTGCALEIERLLLDAGLPHGLLTSLVLPELQVPSTVERLIADERVAGVTLTGSNRAGSAVAALAGRYGKKSLLELGGSDPFVVLPDADLDQVVPAAVSGRFLNTGQSCLCAKRFIVHASMESEFIDAFATAVRQLRVGDPLHEDTQIGPLARADLTEQLDIQVRNSIHAGARVILGGEPLQDRGPAWYAPTIMSEVSDSMPVMSEETFGPVAAVIGFEDNREAIRLANATPYGLGASIWSADLERALALGRHITSGSLFVNANTASDPRLPFGGVRASGYGRELGDAGAVEFTNVRSYVLG